MDLDARTRVAPAIVAKPEGSPKSRRRETAVREVLLAFKDLPPNRLLCFLDDADWPEFKSESTGFGIANRGVSRPVTHPSELQNWPLDLVGQVFPSFSLYDNDPAFNFVIYLHNSTCENPVGLTMTFAHELHHLVQWATVPAVWNANERFKKWCCEFATGFESHDLPIEKEARIVAKRIAIQIHGFKAVNRYIEQNIAYPVNDLDGRNWRYIAGIDVTKPYDVELDTTLFEEELNSRPLIPR